MLNFADGKVLTQRHNVYEKEWACLVIGNLQVIAASQWKL